MLSEGQSGVQNRYSLKDGILKLDLDKATYERCGLTGTVASSPGRKHVKLRFHIELDLKLNSMQHGKKGFERVKWAFKNLLNESLAWLFVDLESDDVTGGLYLFLSAVIKQPPLTYTKDPLLHYTHR
jgi:ribonuclease P/MRP protein subunit RPP40